MYRSIGDYISKIMAGRSDSEVLYGDFRVEVAAAPAEDSCVAAVIHVHDDQHESADFVIYKNGREEYRRRQP